MKPMARQSKARIDGNNGSFFAQPAGRQRYKTPDERQTAHDHIRYLHALMEETPEEEAADVPRETCERHEDHEFEESHSFLHTLVCIKCGCMVENPARLYAEQPIDPDSPPPDAYDER